MMKYRAWDRKAQEFINFTVAAGLMVHMNTRVIEPEDIEQFTGILDMNGREVYHNDIIKINFGLPPTSAILHVEWADGKYIAPGMQDGVHVLGWWFMDMAGNNNMSAPASAAYSNDIEVIGNIHQSPELFPCEHGIAMDQQCLICGRAKGGGMRQ